MGICQGALFAILLKCKHKSGGLWIVDIIKWETKVVGYCGEFLLPNVYGELIVGCLPLVTVNECICENWDWRHTCL